jgi:hypothetical protein
MTPGAHSLILVERPEDEQRDHERDGVYARHATDALVGGVTISPVSYASTTS